MKKLAKSIASTALHSLGIAVLILAAILVTLVAYTISTITMDGDIDYSGLLS